MISKILSVFFLFFFTISHIHAAETPLQQLKSFLKHTRSMTADFKQISFDQNGSPAQTSYGVFFLSRPGRFRWDYQKPFEQQIISHDNTVWFYDADLEQVTIKQIDDSLGATPALLLSGEVDLEKNFTLEQQGTDDDLEWIKLMPKNEEGSFRYILIGLNHGKLAGMELSDNFGQLTRIYFTRLEVNPKLDDAIFEFTVPEGVDVFAQ